MSPSTCSSVSLYSSVSAASQWWRRNKQSPVPVPAVKGTAVGAGVGFGVGVVPQGSGNVSKREFSVSAQRASSGEHSDETYEEFTLRYV